MFARFAVSLCIAWTGFLGCTAHAGTCSTGGGGRGTPPEIDVQRPLGASIVDGGTDDLGLASGNITLTYVIENLEACPLTIGAITFTNAMNVSNLTASAPSMVAGNSTELMDVSFEIGASGTFSFGISIENDDSDENPYDINVIGQVPDVAFSAVLPQPSLLIDNDGDGRPNPSDTIGFSVTLRNGGDDAVGVTRFDLAAPGGTIIERANFSGVVEGTVEIAPDGSALSASLQDVPGGGAEVQGIVTFDLLIENDTLAPSASLQGTFAFGVEQVLTDDPSTTAASDATAFEIGRLSRVPADATSMAFGEATAISERFVAVGSPGNDGGLGAVSIFRVLPNGQRIFIFRLDPPTDFGGVAFGTSLAIDGDMLVVGSADPSKASKGAFTPKVAIYQMTTSGSPELIDQIRANLQSDFGAAVAIDGDVLLIGAPGEDDGPETDSGAVYMYSFAGLASDEPPTRIAPNLPQSNSRFGAAVACAQGKVTIGAPGPEGLGHPGAASIYDAVTGNLTDLTTPDDGQGEFGAAVDMDGETIAIGAPNEPGGGAVFEFDPAGFQMGKAIRAADGEAGARFGADVALDGGQLWVGAPSASVDVNQGGSLASGNFGAVYRFAAMNRAQEQKIGAFSVSSDDFEQQEAFGSSIDAAGGSFIVGAPDSIGLRGAAAFRPREAGDLLFLDGFE